MSRGTGGAAALPEVARRIAGVVAGEVARTGSRGVVVASPPGPGSALLADWLAGAVPVRVPDAGAVADLAGALAAAGAPGDVVEALAWRAAADAVAASERFVAVGNTNKTQLLLDPRPLPARILPLGDLWAHEVHTFGGGAELPPVLAVATAEVVAAVDGALRAWLVDGASPGDALAGLDPSLEGRIRAALVAAEPGRRGLLVPKLEGWTVGLDLAR